MNNSDATERATGTIPSSDDILQALRQAGWLLEQETAASLQRAGFHVATGKAFPDPDDPAVSREIDVHGYRQLYRSDDLSLSVNVEVIAECKQSTMPYVLIGGGSTPYAQERDRLEQQFRFARVVTDVEDLGGGRRRLHSVRAREYLRLDQLPGNPWEPRFLATQMTRLDRKKTWLADNRGIFDSLVYPLAKALTHFRAEVRSRMSSGDHVPGQEWAAVTFYYPVIVTSAPLFAVDTSAATLEAVQVPWATMTREIQSTKVTGDFNIDVVTDNALPQYLSERVDRFCLEVGKVAEAEPQRFVTREDLDS